MLYEKPATQEQGLGTTLGDRGQKSTDRTGCPDDIADKQPQTDRLGSQESALKQCR